MSVSCPESEADFINKVKADLCVFVEKASAFSVLVFPPVNSFFRFLIHQLAQDNFDELRTFSIGEDPDRRIVVCTKDLVNRVDSSKDDTNLNVKVVEETKTCAPPSIMVVSSDDKPSCIQVKKSRSSLPTVGIYRPPAARKGEVPVKSSPAPAPVPVPSPVIAVDEAVKETVKTTKLKARVRRPDQQVYVPRAKRVLDVPEKHVSESKSPTKLIIDSKPAKRRSLSPNATAQTNLPSRASHLVETKKKLCQSSSLSDLDWEADENNTQSETEVSSTMNISPQTVSLPSRVEDLVEKKKKLCQSNSVTEQTDWKLEDNVCSMQSSDVPRNSEEVTHISCSSTLGGHSRTLDITCVDECTSGSSSVINEVTKVEQNVEVMTCDNIIREASSPGSSCYIADPSNLNESSKPLNSTAIPCSDEVELSDDDFHDAISKRKPNCFSDILDVSSGSNESLSSGDSVNLPVTPVQLMKPVKAETSKKASTSKCTRIFNPDECDWDALLDEDGEVLDPFLMKELTSAVGAVQITQPQSDYRNYRSHIPADNQKTRRSIADDDFNHVVEIYSFPKEFKTNDLVAVFSPFKNTGGGFEIKWVDDTHALGVFTSALVAEQVLEYHHPMVRTRPLHEATLESRLKARRLSESIQSFRPRPETCAALARRLVTGALGVKLATAQQEREEEKRVLREAREKRRLAAKQRDDIWNNG